MAHIAIPAVDAYSEACRTKPSLVRGGGLRRRVGLYGWMTAPTKEIHIPETRELTMSVHLGGARRVRVFTEQGLSRSFSKPGDITLIPQGQAVSYRTEGHVEFATIHFPIDVLTHRDGDDSRSGLSKLQLCLFAVHDEYVVSSVKSLMRASNSIQTSHDSARYFSTLLDALTCHVERIVEEGNAEQVRLGSPEKQPFSGPDFGEVLKQIETRLADKLSLEDLADHAGVGRTRFAQEFTKRFGCTPHRFITQRRIEMAKALLRQGERRVTDIAYDLGFSGHSHFSTTFKAVTGCTPKVYLESVLRGSS